jgi:filamentous hemagglutinin family protein
MNFRRFKSRLPLVAVTLAVGELLLWPFSARGQVHSLTAAANGLAKNGASYSSSSSTSQTSTAATAVTAQSVQAAATALQSQAALAKSIAAFQALQSAQQSAQHAAQANAAINLLDASHNIINGLTSGGATSATPGGLSPVGGLTPATSSAIQVVDLSGTSNNKLVISNGGNVTLPGGTTGSDQVAVSGAGSVTTTSGAVTATAGSLTTTTGGTIAATDGGSIALTAGSDTLKASTAAMITSTVGGSYALDGTTVSFSANTATAIPAGATVSFTGSSAATVAISGAATLQLSGAGTLALANAAAGSGGTISTNSGTTGFTSGAVIASQPSGSTVTFTGSGSLAFNPTGNDTLQVIVQPNAVTNTAPAFTTTGQELATQGFTVPASWSGVGALSQSQNGATGQVVDTITQDQQQALLYWQTFNIGKNTTLDFDQSLGGASVGDWVAINRVLDPSLSPSQIFGSIQASGQVYVINQNGIIFNGSSQVNAHALVASTLPINTNLVTGGLLENPGLEYLFTSVAIPASSSTPAYNPNSDSSTLANGQTQANTLPNTASGNIVVDEGASLYSPGSDTGVGGKIALVAPNVTNFGDISSPDGQIILAAGQQVGFVAHPSTDATLRGLDVAIGQADPTDTVINGGTVDQGGSAASNQPVGLIEAPEADVTIAAPNIVQDGIIEGQTSVALDGRIDLLAMSGLTGDIQNQIFDAQQGTGAGGSIQLGLNSVTEILPDYASSDTQVGTSLSLPSEIYVEGASFVMNSGAQMIAPNATVTFGLGILNESIAETAGETSTPLAEDVGSYSTSANGSPIISNNYLSTTGQLTLDSGADLDVSGSSNVQASVSENVVAAQLTDAVLENSPLQRDGPLHDQTVYINVTQTGTNADGSTWVGSPLGDFSGYANLVERSIGELTAAGGSVAINTNGQADLQPNSTVNVSGGSVNYAGATVPTTYLVAGNGRVVNIEQASSTVPYLGIYNGFSTTSNKWGVTQTSNNGPLDGTTYDAGYVQGGNAGSLSIVAPSVSLAGSLYGNTTRGTGQQASPPKAGTLLLNIEAETSTPSNPPLLNVVIQPGSDPASSAPNTLDLSPNLFGIDGFGNATINTGSGKITVASDANLTTLPGSTLDFIAANIEVDGQIDDPSGSVVLTALTQTPTDVSEGNATTYNPDIGNILLGSGSSILATGLTFDELSNATPGTLPFSVNGGKVTLSGAVIDQESGSLIDASGGLARSSGGTVYSGKGGAISLTAYFANSSSLAAGSLTLDGTVSAYGIGQGGSLSLKTLAVAIGAAPSGSLINGVTPSVLPASLFGQGGFSSYSVAGAAGLQIENGTVLDPVLTEEVANLQESQFGVNLVSSSQLPAYPAAPVSLSFSASGATNFINYSQVTLGAGASITLPATSSLSFTGQLVDIQGSATAPGGNITLQGASTSSLPGYQTGVFSAPVVTVYLEAGSSLSVSGETITSPVKVGSTTYNTGEVLPGGSISITGNIVGDPAASLSADGTVGTIAAPTGGTTGAQQSENLEVKLNPYTTETIASNGGAISLNGDEEVYYEGSLSAKAGNGSATGGSFTLGSGLAATYTTPPEAGYADIFIGQSGSTNVGSVTLGGSLSGVSPTGGAYTSVSEFGNSGFGSLIFNGNVEFEGGTASNPITISASKEVELNLSSGNASLFADGSSESVVISAPYIAIGAPTLSISQQNVTADAPIYNPVEGSGVQATPTLGVADPTFGPATLTLNARDLIDVSFLTLQGFGATSLNVSAGDIRGGGLFYGAGNITLNAGQIYTPTGATFTVAAFGDDNSINGGTVDIENLSGVVRPLPFSAGGTLNIFATTINQDGNLEAPFGTINLGAAAGDTVELPDVTPTQNALTGQFFAVANPDQYAPETVNLTLGSKSTTSVSGAANGQTLVLPYGTIQNGTDWIAPNGSDITTGGLIGKGVILQANNIEDASGSVINISGGGELFAYAFNPGVGGTNDILSIYKYANGSIEVSSSGQSISSTSFAVVPTYDLGYSPIDLTVDSSGVYPYANSALTSNIGNEIYLYGGDGITAGSYTILPARYALLPNAYLVTPESTTAANTSANPDGSINMAGYIYNSLNAAQQLVPTVSEFQLASNTVVNERAPYQVASATTFLAQSAAANHVAVPELPIDAGQVVFDASEGLDLQGTLTAQAASGGQGGIVDIGSSDDIYIVDSAGDSPTYAAGDSSANSLTLSAQELDQFNAGSLLIGGVRSSSAGAASIDTLTSNIYVQNDASGALKGSEIILDSKQTIDVASGADIEQTGGASSSGQDLTVGSTSNPGSGDGALIRVTGDAGAQFTRLGVNTADSSADLVIGSGASIGGTAVTLDSSSGASIDPAASIDGSGGGQSLTLSAGAVSLQVSPDASVASAPGLVLESGILQTLESSVQNLVLNSYTSVNFYSSGAGVLGAVGSNGKPVIQSLTLQSGAIYGYGGSVTINAGKVTLENANGSTAPAPAPAQVAASSLTINANTITLGANAVAVDGYSSVQMTANNGIMVNGTGALNVQGSVNLAAPIVTGSIGANYSFNALGGALQLTAVAGTSDVSGGLGATISFNASSLVLDSEVYAPSGVINAQASSGDIDVQSDAYLDAAGETVTFGSATGYTSGGRVNLTSASGNIAISAIDPTSKLTSLIDVSAPSGGGNAGSVTLSAANGQLTVAANTLNGSAGANGTGGTFSATLGGNGQDVLLSSLTTPAAQGGFTTQSYDVTNSPLVTVDGAVGAATGNGISSFTLTVENGGIEVDNAINASGPTGGTINLYAGGGVLLTSNAVLNVTGAKLNDAGEGGTIDIETRGANGGVLDLGAGTLDLGVGAGSSITAAGTVDLRAPLLTGAPGSSILATEDPDASSVVDQTPGGIAISSINPANINNAGSVVVEGYRVYDPSNGTIDSTLINQVTNDVANFPTATLASQLGVTGNALFQIEPGVEIINPDTGVNSGNLTLSNDWDLSTLRTAAGLPGILTLRAENNLIFNGSLTDGFTNPQDGSAPYTWNLLPVGSESWSYRLVAGAAFDASSASTANFGEVVAQGTTAAGTLANGSLELGLTIPQGFAYGTKTSTTADTYAQMIRTGTGNITIDTGGSVYLMNQMATIYTAGQLAPTLAGFNLPTGTADTRYERKIYGTTIEPAPQYAAQYTENGGNVVIHALQDIAHETLNGTLYVADTSWQFPTNWLYRRGATSASGIFGLDALNHAETASTTWWIDFSNFFEGVGALGGGNVALDAGGDIINVDAVIPTNARMPTTDANGNPLADAAGNLVELGGGDLSVIAGGTLEGGAYYVEKGTGLIEAGTISSAGDTARISAFDASLGEDIPLATTLFVGDSSFSVQSTNDVTIGSTVNAFLLPQGINNGFNDNTLFSTYGSNSSVSVSSLLGQITIQGSQYSGNGSSTQLPGGLADAYYSNASSSTPSEQYNLTGTPWTLTLEPEESGNGLFDSVLEYSDFYSYSPPIFRATAFTGNIDYQGDQTLAASPYGTLSLLAAGTVEGAFDSGAAGNGLTATILVLDDNPALFPGVTNPIGLSSATPEPFSYPSLTNLIPSVINAIDEAPSYSTENLATLESQHTQGLLHDNSTTPPVQIDTISGDIEDFTLISPEKTDISSGLDLEDVSLYIQNNNASDLSIVSANRDITLYDPTSSGLLSLGAGGSTGATYGDLQISGPGALEVLAGGNLNLGEGASLYSSAYPGTNLGITSIGQSRDPYLPFGGAQLIVAAGLGDTTGLSSSANVNYTAFENAYLNATTAPSADSSVYLPDLGTLLGVSGASDSQIWDIFSGTADSTLSASELKIQAALNPLAPGAVATTPEQQLAETEANEQKDALATTIFNDVLRDAGRNHNNPSSPEYGSYQDGYNAISTLFPNSGSYGGDITLTSREIKTTNNSDIDILAPGGGIEVGQNNLGAQAVDQGILTVDGGNISIFTNNNVDIGTSRIFTLHGGNIIIWSSKGNIDAGASSRTVQSAPPTRVLVDGQSANVETDLAGLATGGGIGVLETVVGAPPGNVDLIAPVGTVNAGDAGIRASGNINVAAAQVLNAGNIQAGGSKSGVPTTSTPNIAAAVSAGNAAGSTENASNSQQNQPGNDSSQEQDLPSIISVEVLGYGGADDTTSTDQPKRAPSSSGTLLAERPSSFGQF